MSARRSVRPGSLSLVLGIAVSAVVVLPPSPAPAAPSPTDADELGTVLCSDGGITLALAADLTDATGTVTLADACSAVLDLNGRTVTVRNVVLGAGVNLTIRDGADGGTLVADATGANNVAGIQTAGATLRIESGTVTATGGRLGAGASGAGIGGVYDGAGDDEHGGTVIISGGTVTATGDSFAAGIGGSQDGDGGTVTISGGTVTATGGSGAAGAGIGGGYDGDGGDVTITGGTVTATAGGDPAEPIGRGAGTTSSSGSLTLGPRAVDSTVGLVRTISFLPAPAAAAPSPVALSCAPVPMLIGSRVSCAVTGGDPGIDILWRAAYNPVFAEAGVTLDASGAGEFSFVVPRGALGAEVTVELVEWLAPVSLGVVGGPVPGSIPAGEGPVPEWSLVMLVLAGGLVLRRVSTVGPRG